MKNIKNQHPAVRSTALLASIEGKKSSREIYANVGQGVATYVLVEGKWYAANVDGWGIVQDARWEASAAEQEQIIAIIGSRIRRANAG